MIIADSYARNFLQRDERTSLVVVSVDSRGNPDSVSYWKNPGEPPAKRHEGPYAVGALVDIWV